MRLLNQLLYVLTLIGFISCGPLIPEKHKVSGFCHESFNIELEPPHSTHRVVIILDEGCSVGSGIFSVSGDEGPLLKKASLDTLSHRDVLFESDWYNLPLKVNYVSLDTIRSEEEVSISVNFYF
jgi:hypothetical protein